MSFLYRVSQHDTISVYQPVLKKGSAMHSVLKEEGYPVAVQRTLLAQIEGSIGGGQYLSLYIEKSTGDSPAHVDVIENGRFACAYYVSALLHLMNLLDGAVHTTVTETIKDLLASGWYEIDEPVPGAVIIWGPKLASDGKPHRHVGFYLKDNQAVSTDGVTGRPTVHHVTYGTKDGSPARPIQAIYFHKQLRS